MSEIPGDIVMSAIYKQAAGFPTEQSVGFPKCDDIKISPGELFLYLCLISL